MSKGKSFGMQQVQFAVSSAICELNSGSKFHTSLLESMGVSPGTYTNCFCEQLDWQQSTMLKGEDKFKKRRKQLQKQRKGKEDTNTQTEGVMYKSGQF